MKVQAKYKFAFKGVIYNLGDILEVSKEEYEEVKGDVTGVDIEKKKVKRGSNKQVKKAKNK